MFKKILTPILFAISACVFAAPPIEIPKEIKDKIITIIVPYGPGGNSDIIARQLAMKVTDKTGVKTVVINKPGASGSIGASFVASSKSDGLTICQCETGPVILNHLMKIPGSPEPGSLIPVSGSLESSLAIVVKGDAPFNNLKEMESYLRKNSNKAAYANTGTLSLLWSEQFLNFGKIKGVQPILYKSQAEAISSVLSGVTVFVVAGTGDIVKLVEGGKLKAIAIGTTNRIPSWPNVPTMSETYPTMVMTNFNGIYVPKDVPLNIQEFLNAAWSNAVWNIDTITIFHQKGITPVGGDLKRAQKIHDAYMRDRQKLFKQYGSLLDNK